MSDIDDASDLLDLLAADHHRIQQLIDEGTDVRTMIHEITPHLYTENQLLYPELRNQLAADDLVDELVALDHRLEEAMEAAEDIGEPQLPVIVELFVEHAQRQAADAFPPLREAVDKDRLVLLGDALQSVMRTAPTHPHPHIPEEGWRQTLYDSIASSLERFKDLWHDR